MKNNIKNQKGVTLVALVITIIVLLILASITMGSLLGENGTAKESVKTVEASVKKQIIESAKIDISAKELEQNRDINQDELEKILKKYAKEIKYDEDNTTIKSIITNEGYEIDITEIYNK